MRKTGSLQANMFCPEYGAAPIEGWNIDEHGPNPAKCHVVIGHTHLQQEGWSEDGMYRCVALGCMRDPVKTAYIRRGVSKHPKWNQGFGMWKHGYYYSFSRLGTD